METCAWGRGDGGGAACIERLLGGRRLPVRNPCRCTLYRWSMADATRRVTGKRWEAAVVTKRQAAVTERKHYMPLQRIR